jgi:4-carboxymuconolactone decarboxylase
MPSPNDPIDERTLEEGSEILERFRAPAFIREDLTALALGTGAKVWTREGLSPKYRSLATIPILAALGRRGALREHIGLGLDNGLSPREICEALFQCAMYAGFPACVEAMEIVHDVFEERGIEG